MKPIFGLFIFIFIVLLVGLLFETHIETYKNQYSFGVSRGIIGYKLNNTYVAPKNNDRFGNLRYPGKSFLNIAFN